MLPQSGVAPAAELLVVGIPESSPPEYIGKDASSATGFAMEFIEDVAEDAGYSIMLRRFPDWQTVMNELEQGHIHIVPLMTVTEKHKKIARFTAPVASYTMGMFIRASSTDLHGIEDLQGRRVAVVAGDIGYAIARELQGILIREAVNAEQLLVMLLSGQVDAVIYSTSAIQYIAAEAGLLSRISVLDDRLLQVNLAVAVTPKREDMFTRLDAQVRKFVGTRAFNTLHDKWYTGGTFVHPVFTVSGRNMGIAGTVLLGALLAFILWRRRKGTGNRDLFSALLAGMESAVILVSPDEEIAACNRPALVLFGMEGGVRPGTHFPDLFSGDESIRKRSALRRVMETGESVESLHESGGRLYRVSMIPVVFSDDAQPFVSVMLRDVTERNLLENLLQEARSSFELIFEKSPEGIAILHNNMTFGAVNSAFARFLGYSQDELVAKSLREVMYSEDADEARLELHKVFVGDVNSVRMEKRFLHRNGVPVWGSLTVSVQRSEQGVITGIYAHVLDIHERKVSEQRLRESEQRYREIFERASDLILLVNLSSGRIEEFNQAVVTTLGYSVSELSGMSITDIECCSSDFFGTRRHGESGQRGQGSEHGLFNMAVQSDRRTGQTSGQNQPHGQYNLHGASDELFETRLRKYDGTYLDVQAHTKVLIASGRQYGLSVLRDISGMKALESRLLQAKELAEHVSRTRDDFFANISPELRTPLQGILGVMQLIDQTALDDVQREYVRLARETGNSLMRFMDDLIDFVGLEQSASPLSEGPRLQNMLTPFVVDELFTTVINSFNCEATLKGASLRVVIDSVIPEMIVGAGQRIRQILFNLVGYTLQYARGGHVRIGLRQPHDGVIETGNGMRMTEFAVSLDAESMEAWHESMKRVFEANAGEVFDTSRTFGLMMAKRLATQIQGSIYVDSSEGDMEIVLRLPLRWTPRGKDASLVRTLVAEAVALHESGSPLSQGTPDAGHGKGQPHTGAGGTPLRHGSRRGENALLGGIRVVVADDDSVNRLVVGRWLQIHGGTVAYAENGQDVLTILRAGSYDCVVMDLQMPEMSGLEAAHAIRAGNAGEAAASIPIMAFTAFAIEENREACQEAGMNGFFSKPIDLSELSMSIMQLVVPNQAQEMQAPAASELSM